MTNYPLSTLDTRYTLRSVLQSMQIVNLQINEYTFMKLINDTHLIEGDALMFFVKDGFI